MKEALRFIKLIKGDITSSKVDAIVNAANSYLQHGGGVAGVIVEKGGEIIQKESNKIGYVPVGEAAITIAGKLPCKYVIHAVGPRMGEGNEDEKLKNAIRNTLKLATEKNFNTISVPAISSGIFGFPKDRCAKILLEETFNFLKNEKTSLKIVEFCIIDDLTFNYFKKEFEYQKEKNKDCKTIIFEF